MLNITSDDYQTLVTITGVLLTEADIDNDVVWRQGCALQLILLPRP